MANPRKFSEKIALHTHRQAEETAAFERIMKEVSDARVDRRSSTTSDKNTLLINSQVLGAFRGGSLPNVSAGQGGEKSPPLKPEPVKLNDDVQQPQTVNTHRQPRARSQAGPIRRRERLDTSPYSSGPFLSPPPDTSWRRTNSDSALHQTAMQGMSMGNDNLNRGWMMQNMNGPMSDGRPKSSCEVPRVPGINIYHTAHDPSLIQIPISNNTGSLPDLTNVEYTSPIHAPLDDHEGSSPYSSSPVNTSPSTLSPTSIPAGVRTQGRFQFTPVSSAQPNHLSVPVRYPRPKNVQSENDLNYTQMNEMYHQQPSSPTSHLSVPPNSRFSGHHNKNVPLDKNIGLVDGDYTQLGNMTQIYQQQCPPTSPSPTLQQTAAYRSPRPSPQSSPSLGGRHSAPCSPGAPSPLPNEYTNMYSNQQQFQQQFDQLSMLDPPVGQQDNMNSMQNLQEVSPMNNIDLTSDNGYNQLVYPSTSPSIHAPSTPTSIPNIVLTTVDDVSRQDLNTQLENEFLDFRADLGSLDFDSFQMLSNNGISLADSVEDNFRLDRS